MLRRSRVTEVSWATNGSFGLTLPVRVAVARTTASSSFERRLAIDRYPQKSGRYGDTGWRLSHDLTPAAGMEHFSIAIGTNLATKAHPSRKETGCPLEKLAAR